MGLSSEDYNKLKAEGYSDSEIQTAVEQLEFEDMQKSAQSSTGSSDPRSKSQTSAFYSQKISDMARFQLELNDLLEQTEHVLKGDIVVYENGMKIWKENPYPENNPLNKEGIRKIMLELQNYINRHIILGDYDEKDINQIMKDYAHKFKNLIFMKYEEMGMDTERKRQEFQSIVMNVVNLVYGSYARAKNGAERRSLREMINIQQSNQQVSNNEQQNNTRGLLNPLRYIAGKNK